jgi:hypothetical protein
MGQMEQPPAPQGTSVFDALLTQCRDIFCGQVDKAIAGMFDKADEALNEIVNKTPDREAKKVFLEAQEAAPKQRAEFEKLFRARMAAEFQTRTNKVKKIGGSFSDVRVSSLELSLVADDDLEETLKFNEMAAKLRRICDDEMNALDQRAGVLLGDAGLQAEDNPFSPQTICDAYKQTCRRLVESAPVREVFLRLFDDHVLDEIRAVYKALNDLLVQNSILPKIRYAVAPQEEGKGPKRKKKKKKEAKERADDEDDDEDEGGGEDMFAALQKLLAGAGGGAGAPGAGMGVGGVPMMQGVELLGSLTKLQLDNLQALAATAAQLPAGAVAGGTNVLHELKKSEVGASMGQVDAMTLDVVAMLFDQLFDDAKIPLGAKGLIGRLQIPMLKVAIADKELFSKKTHPARLLLDTLGEIAIRLPADFNAGSKLFAHLETILQELITGYQDDVEIFNIVKDQLTTLMAREDERIENDAKKAAERVLQEEALAVAKSVAQEEVRARVSAAPLPGPVLEFLVQQWLKLMILIHVRRGPASDAWKNAIEAMEQLIWSVQPKDNPEDRRKLATVVPPLLKRLGAGMEVAGIEHEVREFFFDELMKAHTKIMSAPMKSEAPAEPVAPAALDFTASITVKNPYGAGEVQVKAEDLSREDEPDHGISPDNLKVGDWMEFKIKTADGAAEEIRPVRLIFITPRKTRFIFTDRNEKEYIECTRANMFNRLLNGEAEIMSEEPEVPFFERIMGGVISKMRGAPAHA